jgi:antitoxin component YwqK of YwqJK toxin-antitoxin module
MLYFHAYDHKLQNRGQNILYLQNQDIPFTSQTRAYQTSYDQYNEVFVEKVLDLNFKNGRLDGLIIMWYSGGRKNQKLFGAMEN